jgi:hypothetical protein
MGPGFELESNDDSSFYVTFLTGVSHSNPTHGNICLAVYFCLPLVVLSLPIPFVL